MARVLTLLTCLLLSSPGWAAGIHPLAAEVSSASRDADRAATLHLVLDDVHALYGGSRFELEDGLLVHTHVPRAAQPTVETRHRLTPEELVALAELLGAQRVWDQEVPDRTPLPDEGRTVLTVEMGDASARMWEWHNDLRDNDRLVKIERMLSGLAPAGAP